jgi:4-amino-4-deoxy-L-arabinose transferase-like glycosyltransferase
MSAPGDPSGRASRGIVTASWLTGSILVLASILRLAGLDRLPPAPYRDVAITAWDALQAAAGHPRLHFTLDEGLYADLLGIWFRLFGASDWTLRLQGALLGIVTCAGTIRLGRRLGHATAGLLAGFLLALWPWHVILSRSGFRVVMLPALLVYAFTFLADGLAQGGLFRFALAGALLGLGVHVYPAARFAPFIVPFFLLGTFGRERDRWRRGTWPILVLALSAAIVAAPMILHYLRHPADFVLANRVVWVFSPALQPDQARALFGESLLATALMFHFKGDPNWRHNIAGAPMIDPLSGLLLLAGIAVAVAAVVRGRGRERGAAALLLAWLPIMLLPTALSVQGVPHGLRAAGALPATALLCGLGGEALLHRAAGRFGRAGARAIAVGACACLVLWGGWRFFGVWARSPELFAAHDGPFRAAAHLLQESPPGCARLLVANGTGTRIHGWPAEVFPYLYEMRGSPPQLLGPRDAERLELKGGHAWVALVVRDEHVLDLIRRLNPGARIRELEAPGLAPESPVFAIE